MLNSTIISYRIVHCRQLYDFLRYTPG